MEKQRADIVAISFGTGLSIFQNHILPAIEAATDSVTLVGPQCGRSIIIAAQKDTSIAGTTARAVRAICGPLLMADCSV